MLAVIVIAILAALNGWLGWKRIRGGLIVAVLLPVGIGLVAAFSIAVPSDAGGPWVFAVSFVVLAGVSLAFLGLGRIVRRLFGN